MGSMTKCPICNNELTLVKAKYDESYNFSNSLPKGWIAGHKVYLCNICHSLRKPYCNYVELKDGSLYAYDIPNHKNVWFKINKIVRNVPKEKIIGGYFVQ
jgi:CDGSH-type Zn-finger protein